MPDGPPPQGTRRHPAFRIARDSTSPTPGRMHRGILIVLGSPNDEHGELHSVGVERCTLALRLHRANPTWSILLTGGFGAHFNTTDRPHAHYLHAWLLAHGAAPQAFLRFAESRTTLEDASCAKPLVLESGARFAVVITSDYHLARARFIFEREFAGSGVTLLFLDTPTDASICRLDLEALRRHEVTALDRLRREAGGLADPGTPARQDLS